MKKMNSFVTTSAKETNKLGQMLAKELRGGEVIALQGELGSGKTTFAQGALEGLGAKGPYTSPTFLVMKHYKKEIPNPKSQIPNKSKFSKSKIRNIFHIDCYRVGAQDILNLGWKEIISDKKNVVIVEWVEKIKKIVPKGAVWVKFKHRGKDKREISLNV